jgi:hypothetical protein
MIARGTREEQEAQHRIAYWRTMIRHWNVEADNFRRAAKGGGWVTSDLCDEAERTRTAVREAIARADQVNDDLPAGHELRTDLMGIVTALSALSESLAISVEELEPLIRNGDHAGLRYLVAHGET